MISPRTGIWIPSNFRQIGNWWLAFAVGLHVILSANKEKARSV